MERGKKIAALGLIVLTIGIIFMLSTAFIIDRELKRCNRHWRAEYAELRSMCILPEPPAPEDTVDWVALEYLINDSIIK